MLTFDTVEDWKQHEARMGPTRASYQECIWRQHGAPGQAIQALKVRNVPATLENIIADCKAYALQENDEFFNENKVVIELAKLIECGVVWINGPLV